MTGVARRRGTAVVVGGGLLILGVREGLLLSHADDDTARARARQLGLTRVGAGLAILTRPQLLAGALGLGNSDAARWLPRLLAVREVALGVGATAASRDKADPWPWLMTIAAVDGAEAAVLARALRSHGIDPAGGSAFLAADLGSASAVALRVARLAGRTTR